MTYRVLAINPGSTSTKLALYDDGLPAATATVRHSADELARFHHVFDQYPLRRAVVLKWLAEQGVDPRSLAAAVGRGGIVRPIPGGTYRVGPRMLADLKAAEHGEHAANLGAPLAWEVAQAAGGIPALIVDPVVVDEMEPVARLSGLPEIPRRSLFHALNQKAVARRCARDLGRTYEQVNLVVVHLGGGVTVGAHRCGRVIDVANGLDGDGPMAPERAGGLPVVSLVHLCFSWVHTLPELSRLLVGGGGMMAHLGTQDARAVEERVLAGDAEARRVYQALAYQVAKEVGRCAVALRGRVDRVVLTGGLAHSELLTGWIRAQVEWAAPVALYPGEDEMQALAEGALRVLSGEEQAREY